MIFPRPASTAPVAFVLAFVILCANGGPVGRADETLLPGHSANGEAFNEGPRQAAVLMPGMGAVEFQVTTKSELAQKFFTQGVGQLHGFWYFEAERSFRQAAALDPECAMAYWGMAMANIDSPKRAADFMKVAVAKKGATRREQLWLSAFGSYYEDGGRSDENKRKALVTALEELIYEFPDDLEAKAFLVFQLWDNSSHGLPITSRLAVDALAKQILAVNPMHPVHHYLIHLWNKGDGDKRALAAAERCGQAAPGIAHMWHMPGHTYSKLHRYADAAWQQEASARVDHAYMASARIMPEQIHNYAHNNNWLVEDLEYVGRVRDAQDLAMNMIELPRLGPSRSLAYNMGRERLLELCVRFELWPRLLALEGSMYLAPEEKPDLEVKRLAALAAASFSVGNMGEGEKKLSDLQGQLKRAREERVAAADAAEAKAKTDKKSDDEVVKAMAAAMRDFSYRISTSEAAIAEAKIYRELAHGNTDAVKPLLGAARDISADRRSRILLTIGDKNEAVKLARQASDADPAQVQPLANLAGVLWEAGQKEAARESFEKLRQLSAGMDLDLPVMERLAPLASELNLPADWRAKAPETSAAYPRPELKTLGPFRWHPYTAPPWSLDGNDGVRHSLADFKGKPVLIVFYLGSGCSRCIEQLNILAPLTPKFSAAGIQVVAVSTESADGFQRTFAKSHDGNGFPFPILSDAALDAFKTYRAYDDFEHMPLHGAFLVDGSGFVRWQNISYQPFRDADWLLGEAKRLLSVPAGEPRTAAN
jgi:peroxiredoxin